MGEASSESETCCGWKGGVLSNRRKLGQRVCERDLGHRGRRRGRSRSVRATTKREELNLEFERMRGIFFDFFLSARGGDAHKRVRSFDRVGGGGTEKSDATHFGDSPETVEDPLARAATPEGVLEDRANLGFPKDLEQLDRVVGPRLGRDGAVRDALPCRV